MVTVVMIIGCSKLTWAQGISPELLCCLSVDTYNGITNFFLMPSLLSKLSYMQLFFSLSQSFVRTFSGLWWEPGHSHTCVFLQPVICSQACSWLFFEVNDPLLLEVPTFKFNVVVMSWMLTFILGCLLGHISSIFFYALLKHCCGCDV